LQEELAGGAASAAPCAVPEAEPMEVEEVRR